MKRQCGFTLIELLVVVAIIVALLAILLPSFGRAIELGNRAVCASQLKQLVYGTLGYTSDNQGALYDTNSITLQWVNRDVVEKVFDAYCAGAAITRCPNYLYGNTLADGVTTSNYNGHYAQLGYLYTGHKPTDTLGPTPGYPDSANWQSPRAVRDGGQLVLWADRAESPIHTYHSRFTHTPGGWWLGNAGVTAAEAGADGTHAAHLDASVRWVPGNKMTARSSPAVNAVFWW